jgi:[ribosomal protein S18]-alanine N-acetyltransferase
MLRPPSPFHLRPMHLGDLTAVMAIDRLSFPIPTREVMYRYELTGNERAHYQVLTIRTSTSQSGGHHETVIGYAGYWLLVDEVHISTIAIHPDWRGRGLGELLFLNILSLACAQAAAMVTLEVRVSNKTAQALYQKYNLEVVGERPRYYNNGEDALIMTAVLADTHYCHSLPARQTALFAYLAAKDYSTTTPGAP